MIKNVLSKRKTHMGILNEIVLGKVSVCKEFLENIV